MLHYAGTSILVCLCVAMMVGDNPEPLTRLMIDGPLAQLNNVNGIVATVSSSAPWYLGSAPTFYRPGGST